MKKFYQITFPRNCGNIKLWLTGNAGVWFQFAIWNLGLVQYYSKADHKGDKFCFSFHSKRHNKYFGTAWQW